MWLRIDDHYADHPKVIGLSDGAFRLHMRAMCYSASHLTDGAIPTAWLRGHDDEAEELVAAGLFEVTDTGVTLHDWHDHNPDARSAKERRARISAVRAEAGRRGAASRWKDGNHDKPMTSAQQPGMAIATDAEWQDDGPVPVPVPKEKKEKERRFAPPSVQEVRDHVREKGYTFDAESFHAFYESKGWKIGTASMKSWQAACVTWAKRQTAPTARPPARNRTEFELDAEAAQIKKNREADIASKRKAQRDEWDANEAVAVEAGLIPNARPWPGGGR